MIFGFFCKDPAKLLKSATAHRREGRLDEAIRDLTRAYKAIASGDTSYPVETYLRLPLYLQEAGRPAEAWTQFQLLLRQGFPLMLRDPSVLPMYHAEIYDKMRAFLHRQGHPLLAACYAVASRYATALGLYRQKRVDELLAILDVDSERDAVTKALRAAKAAERVDVILAVTAPFRKNIAASDPSLLIRALCDALRLSPEYVA